jgi:hypothetical protein
MPYGEGLAVAEPDVWADALAEADTEAEALPDALAEAEAIGSGLGVGDGKSVVGTFARERAKIRTTIARTMTTHGRASESLRGGSAPR